MKTKTLRQYITINAAPIKIYNAFMDEKQHDEFTGFAARIENKTGGFFNTCGNRNWGYSLNLDPAKRIIQAWRQKSFPDEHYTIIDISLNEISQGKTRINFVQFGVPDDCIEWLKPGWQETYWQPLKLYLEKGIKQKRRE